MVRAVQVGHVGDRRVEGLPVSRRLVLVQVERRRPDATFLQGTHQGLLIDDGGAASVHQGGVRLHERQALGVDQVARRLAARYVQRDVVRVA